jgi:hypothetical protein
LDAVKLGPRCPIEALGDDAADEWLSTPGMAIYIIGGVAQFAGGRPA